MDRYKFNEIGERIRELRKAARMNQEQFIEKLNDYDVKIARNRLSGIENGVRESFSLDLLLAACEIFKCDMGYLLGEYSERNRDNHEICEYTGLSECAIETIKELKEKSDSRAWSDLLSCIIADVDFPYLLGVIESYITVPSETIRADFEGSTAFINKKDLSLFSANNALKDILERISADFLLNYLTTSERLDILMKNKLEQMGIEHPEKE